jgi:hypothetical protein
VQRNPRIPVMFSSKETDEILSVLRSGDTPAVCPRCGHRLRVSGPIANPARIGPHFRVSCRSCQRMALIRNVGESGSSNVQQHG